MRKGDGFWTTEERVEELRKLHAEGLSHSTIADSLFRKFGDPITKNTVTGKLNRLGLSSERTLKHSRAHLQQKRRSATTAAHRLSARQRARVDGSMTIYGIPRKVEGGKSQSERIKEKVSQGLSPKAIAEELGIDHVRGVIYRLNIGAEQHDPILDVAAKPLLELEAGDCRFPVGDPQKAGFGFCARPKQPGSSYCPGHLKRSLSPLPQPTRKPFVLFKPGVKTTVKEDA